MAVPTGGIITSLIQDADQQAMAKKQFERETLIHAARDHPDPEVKGEAMARLLKEHGKLGPKESQNLLRLVQMVTGGAGTQMGGASPNPSENQPYEQRLATGAGQPSPSAVVQPAPATPAASAAPPAPSRGRRILGGLGQVGAGALAGALTQGRSAEYRMNQWGAERQQQQMLERERQQSQLRTGEEIGREKRAEAWEVSPEKLDLYRRQLETKGTVDRIEQGKIITQMDNYIRQRVSEGADRDEAEREGASRFGLTYHAPTLIIKPTGAPKVVRDPADPRKWRYQQEFTDGTTKLMPGEAPIPSSEKAPRIPLADKAADDWLQKPENAGKGYSDYIVWRAKQTSGSQVSTLTQGALDVAARLFISTGGSTPSFGMAGRQDKEAILNRVAQMAPNLDPGQQKAVYDSLKGSLVSMQKQRDAIVAFEQTATANLDQFLETAKSVVDSGSPWLNTPLRAVERGGLGAAELSAYDAARRVAVNEVAKVIANPNLTGQLSDSARREVEAFIPENATLAQAYSVANLLKADMARRHQWLDNTIESTRASIGGLSGGTVTPSGAVTPSGTAARPKPPRPGAALDVSNANRYLQLAGGDKKKAFEMATADGWKP